MRCVAEAWPSNEKRRNGSAMNSNDKHRSGMAKHRNPTQWLSTAQLGKAWI
nr:MAG TPA: hypothetical protein [Caudoviricetes sp.]DAJ32820.1 MAG TPA: hypothetical protein [Caudoviricetes sp.]